jgi:hypothetical protein
MIYIITLLANIKLDVFLSRYQDLAVVSYNLFFLIFGELASLYLNTVSVPTHSQSFFFSKNAGDLRLIILRRRV